VIVPILLALADPGTLRIVTRQGETSIPISVEHGVAVAAPLLAGPLDLAVVVDGSRATVVLRGIGFIFAIGTPYVRTGDRVCQLASESYVARDTLFLPLTWVADCVPRVFGVRFRWDPTNNRLTETATPTPAAGTAAALPRPSSPVPVVHAGSPPALPPPNPLTGLRLRHGIVIDPGHGGRDPGNPGRYFPKGMTEKDVNLMIARLLRAELQRRGITASVTRASDTLIDLHDRAGYCKEDCDLFVSIHVNSMPAGRHSGGASGVETYFLSDAKTEDQRRVAEMENDAIRFETAGAQQAEGDLGHILKDLQQNEYLRESARLAELVQQRVAAVHPGGDRGVQQAAFFVLSSARRPAVLVETGFSTNRGDGEFLASALGQRRIANAIADGVVAYLLEFERRTAGTGSGR